MFLIPNNNINILGPQDSMPQSQVNTDDELSDISESEMESYNIHKVYRAVTKRKKVCITWSNGHMILLAIIM